MNPKVGKKLVDILASLAEVGAEVIRDKGYEALGIENKESIPAGPSGEATNPGTRTSPGILSESTSTTRDKNKTPA
jgi:hypothetical protein